MTTIHIFDPLATSKERALFYAKKSGGLFGALTCAKLAIESAVRMLEKGCPKAAEQLLREHADTIAKELDKAELRPCP